MSGVKHVKPNYQQLYQQELSSRQRLEQRNNELERRNRENELIAGQIAQSEARVRHDLEVTQRAARQAAEELVHLHDLERRTLEAMGNVQVQLNVTRDTVNAMRWESQQANQQIVETQREIHRQVEQNRSEILTNRVRLQEGFDRVQQKLQTLGDHVDNIERWRRAEEMRTAAQMLETIINVRYFASEDILARFSPDVYENAQRLLRMLQQRFEAGEYQAVIQQGAATITAMTDAVNMAEQAYRQYREVRERALNEYDRVMRSLHGLDNDATHFWALEEFHALEVRANELRKLADSEAYETLFVESQALNDAATQLSDQVEDAVARHVARTMVAKSFVEALIVDGSALPLEITVEDVNDPNSDVIIPTSDGQTIHLPLNGEMTIHFANDSSPALNERWVENLSQAVQKQQVGQLVINRGA